MKKFVLGFACVLFCAASVFGQAAPAGENLESVLTQMDHAADKFKSAQADFEWDQYQKIVNETDVQKGKVSFLHGTETQMAANITEPDKKILIFVNGKLTIEGSKHTGALAGKVLRHEK